MVGTGDAVFPEEIGVVVTVVAATLLLLVEVGGGEATVAVVGDAEGDPVREEGLEDIYYYLFFSFLFFFA